MYPTPDTLAPGVDGVQMKPFSGDLYHGGTGKPDPLAGHYSQTRRSHALERIFAEQPLQQAPIGQSR